MKIKSLTVLIIILLMTGISVTAYAEEKSEITSGDYVYTITGDMTAEILKYNGNEKKVSIPNKLDDKTVTIIGNEAFKGNTTVETIQLGNNVGYIGDRTFMDCTALKNITNYDGLLEIGDSAFENCINLEEFYIPNKLVLIGNDCFVNCEKISGLELPNTLMIIGDHSFGYRKDSTNNKYTVIENFEIEAYKGTIGHKYAVTNNIGFVEGEIRSIAETISAHSTLNTNQQNSPSAGENLNENSNSIAFYIILAIVVVLLFAGAGLYLSKNKTK
ncbi:MAG: leucine-rich repeat domain-containing protein [Lachnospiraceae bacterium]|nr:leucine-rich repeat domain-containing protein [Lachnospiraceae bacterium]